MNSEPKQTPPSRTKNLVYAATAGQAGCLTLGVVFVALFAGMWLDAQFGVRGPFIIGLLLLSIPISLFLMVRIALGSVKQIQPPPQSNVKSGQSSQQEEEEH